MITAQDFITAEEQYISLTDKELEKLAKKAVDEQPAIFVFVATYYDLLEEQDNKEFYLQLIYAIWIAYNKKYTLKRKLSIDEVEKMDEADEKLMNDLNNNEDAMLGEAMKRLTAHPQAELLGYLYQQIGDFFGFDEIQDEDLENGNYKDSGLISGAVNSFINFLEKTKQVLFVP